MQNVLLLLIGVLITASSVMGQTLESDRQILFDEFPTIRSMRKEKASNDGKYTDYWFRKGEAQYTRTYYSGARKMCFHTFSIERAKKRYHLSYSGLEPSFYTETFSEKENKWVKSKEIDCKVSDLPSQIRFTLEVTQGTLSSYR